MLLSLRAWEVGALPNLSCPWIGNKGRESIGRGCWVGLPAGTSPSFHRTAPAAVCRPRPRAARNISCPLSWFNESKELSCLTSEETHFDVYLKASSKCACTIEAACEDRSGTIAERSDKTFLSRFGVLRRNTPICQKRFVRGHKVSTTLFALAFWFLDSDAGASVQTRLCG